VRATWAFSTTTCPAILITSPYGTYSCGVRKEERDRGWQISSQHAQGILQRCGHSQPRSQKPLRRSKLRKRIPEVSASSRTLVGLGPNNMRILYNRASCDRHGNPYPGSKPIIWWDDQAKRRAGYDVSDVPVPTDGPSTPNGQRAFHLNPEGSAGCSQPFIRTQIRRIRRFLRHVRGLLVRRTLCRDTAP